MSIHRILVAIDFSETSADALRVARDFARAVDGKLVLLHVTPDPANQPWTDVPVDYAQLRGEWEDEARRRLHALASLLGITAKEATIEVSAGYPASRILRVASEQGIDLIVMGTHGHGAARRFLLGGIADRVTHRATCPVLTVPSRVQRDLAPGAAGAFSEREDQADTNRG